MGLDGVELVMEVEDRFNVTLTDAMVSRVHTVADLAALVIARLPKSDVCPTARSFFELRAALTDHAGVERRHVRPRTPLAELLPAKRRRSIWRGVRRRLPRLPGLEMSGGWRRALRWIGSVLAVGWFVGLAMLWSRYGLAVAVPIGLVSLMVGSFVFAFCFSPLFERHVPAGIDTVGDLARAIAPIELPAGGSGAELVMRLRVLDEVRAITAEQLGIPIDRVLPTSDFIKDLRID